MHVPINIKFTYTLSPYFSNVAKSKRGAACTYARTHICKHTHTHTHTNFLRKNMFANEFPVFPSGVDEVSVLHGCDIASLGIFLGMWLKTFGDNEVMSCSRLKMPKKNPSTLEDRPLCCQETSETQQTMAQRHIPDVPKSQ